MADQKNALISLYDKEGIEEFADGLTGLGWNIYASGGTAKRIEGAGIEVTDVAELVGGSAILGHRVVTLSREVHAGLLAKRDSKEDRAELERLGIPLIDLAAVDMYPLLEALADPSSTDDDILEKTDIGGPTMLRSAAKGRRIVLSRVEQRPEVLAWLQTGKPDEEEFRKHLAGIAEFEAATYILESAKHIGGSAFFGITGEKVAEPLYGENPWQKNAGVYISRGSKNPLAFHRFEQHGGIEPSYNNVAEFAERMTQTMTHIAAGFEKNFGSVPAIAIGVKHGNACGAAFDDDPAEAIKKMLRGDPRAIFGGSVMLNFELDEELANLLMHYGVKKGATRPLDIVVAAGIEQEVTEVLQRKTGRLRLLTNPALLELGVQSLDTAQRYRYIPDGVVVQDNYTFVPKLKKEAQISAGGWVSEQQEKDLILAWGVGSTSNSNTIPIVKDGMLLGNGVGQQDRVGAAELAIKRAVDSKHKTRLKGAVGYSDSFFPYPDAPESLVEAGIGVILTSSGSINDPKVFERMKELGIKSFLTMPDGEVRGFFGH
jgi:phosphoribosylaminoimidazolecarboxamide formyltransferase / IMP cyclohydrolase